MLVLASHLQKKVNQTSYSSMPHLYLLPPVENQLKLLQLHEECCFLKHSGVPGTMTTLAEEGWVFHSNSFKSS